MKNVLRLSLIVSTCCVAVLAGASEPDRRPKAIKPAWAWSVDERLAVRFDRAEAKRRVEARRVIDPAIGNRWVDVIDGSRNPELFLPAELFDSVIRHGYVGETWRDDHVDDLPAAGLPSDFWERLEDVAAPYIENVQRREMLLRKARHLTEAERDAIQRELSALEPTACRNGAEALARARKMFGAALDRFMYASIAPNIAVYSDEFEDREAMLRTEGGCR